MAATENNSAQKTEELKEFLTEIRRKARISATINLERETKDTNRSTYNFATEAVAADFLLRVVNNASIESLAEIDKLVNSWRNKSPGTSPIDSYPRDKKIPFHLPQNLKIHFNAALNDPENIFVKIPTHGSRHIGGLDEHNEKIGRRTLLKAMVRTAALATGAIYSISTHSHAKNPAAEKTSDDVMPALDTKELNTIGKIERYTAAPATALTSAGIGAYLLSTHKDEAAMRRTVPELVRHIGEIITLSQVKSVQTAR